MEEILRQLREEEIGRTLAMLEGRFRKMLEQEIRVYEGTLRLHKIPESNPHALWEVLDPVSPDNNIVRNWKGYEIDELAEWLETARDIWPRVTRCDEQGKDAESLHHLVDLFGNPIKHHCGD